MIHTTAIIDPRAEVGAEVKIGAYSVVEADVRIGDGCEIGPHVSLMRYTSLGAGCRVHAGAVLGDLPQDTGFAACRSHVRIGVNCVIREGVTVHRGTAPESGTEIGDGCWLMAMSHVAHNVRLGQRVIVANGALLAGYVTVGDGAFISGNCMIHQFCRIGRLAMLGGGSGASKDVPPFCLLAPIALNTLAGLNTVGLRRAGLDVDERKALKQAFMRLFRSGRNLSEAVAGLRAGALPPLAMDLCDFIEASKRGICTPAAARKPCRDDGPSVC